jgi:predicted transglutaminase-like cysteine proteinase
MRQTAKILAMITVIGTMIGSTASEAAFFSFPRALISHLDRIGVSGPTLAPMAHTLFCMRYADDCAIHGVDFRRRNIALTPERWNELNTINREVNRDIIPERNMGGIATEEWLISPPAGDCNDYAVTKRHELLARGWPSRTLLLSEVVVPSGEHHLVLVVRLKEVDLVLDNLSANIRPIAIAARMYEWVRVESPYNPKFWTSVNFPTSVRLAAISD